MKDGKHFIFRLIIDKTFKDNDRYVVIMKIIKDIIKKFIKEDKKVLGRWNIEYCNKKMNQKIDLSNEDHCGPCGQYTLDKINTNLNTDIKTDLNKK
jgi:hypothetical protein